jgi:hypothetical protein
MLAIILPELFDYNLGLLCYIFLFLKCDGLYVPSIPTNVVYSNAYLPALRIFSGIHTLRRVRESRPLLKKITGKAIQFLTELEIELR